MKTSRRTAYVLLLFPLLVVAGQTVVQHTLSRVQSASTETHLAGRQLYLMERIGRHASLAQSGVPSAQRAFRSAVSEWADVHESLVNGSRPRGTVGVRSPAIRASLDSLTPLVRAVTAAALDASSHARNVDALALVQNAERAYTPAMSRIAFALDDAASRRVLRLRRLVGAIGIALVAVAVLVGLPMLRGKGTTEAAPRPVGLNAATARATSARRVPGLLTGFRWTMSLGAVVVVGTWGVNELVGRGGYVDPLALRLLVGATLVAAGLASHHPRFTLRTLRPVAVSAAFGVLLHQSWLGATNGLDPCGS